MMFATISRPQTRPPNVPYLPGKTKRPRPPPPPPVTIPMWPPIREIDPLWPRPTPPREYPGPFS